MGLSCLQVITHNRRQTFKHSWKNKFPSPLPGSTSLPASLLFKYLSSLLPRLHFTPSLQIPLLPSCYHCRLHSPFSEATSDAGYWGWWQLFPSATPYFSLFFSCCSFLLTCFLCCGVVLPHDTVPFWRCACSHGGLSMDCSCSGTGHLLLLWPCFLLLPLSSIFSPFLNIFSQRCHKVLQLAHLWPVVCPLLIWLELAVTGCGPDLLSWMPTLQLPIPSSRKNIPCHLYLIH